MIYERKLEREQRESKERAENKVEGSNLLVSIISSQKGNIVNSTDKKYSNFYFHINYHFLKILQFLFNFLHID